jgi:hypothetical protein
MERRRSARRVLAAGEPLTRAKLRTGSPLTVVDASSWGVLAETAERLLPGRRLDVHVVTPGGRVLARTRVARAYVCRLQSDAICYRAALAFEEPIDTRASGYEISAALAGLPPASQTDPDRIGGSDVAFDERLTA